jgi:hypothetical protein
MDTKLFRSAAREKGAVFDEDRDALHVQRDNPFLLSLHLASRHVPLLRDLGLKLLTNDTAVEFIASDVGVTLTNTWYLSSGCRSPLDTSFCFTTAASTAWGSPVAGRKRRCCR